MSAMLQDLVHSLYEIIEDAKSIPLSSDKCIIDRDKVLYLINETIRCMPEDLNMARDIVDRRNHILSEAKAQAEAVLKNAEKEAAKLISEENITTQAQKEAREILLSAQTKSGELRKISSDFCDDSLKRAEEGVALILEEVKTTRRRFKGIK